MANQVGDKSQRAVHLNFSKVSDFHCLRIPWFLLFLIQFELSDSENYHSQLKSRLPKMQNVTLPVFLLEDRRTIHNLIFTVITTVKGSKEPLPWIKVNPLDLFIGLCADLFINGICGSVYELFYYSWLFVSMFVCLVFWLGTKLAFLQYTVGMTTIWTTNKHKTLRLGWIKLTREHA